MWLCPFKAVTEFPAVRNVETAIQMGIFVALFVGLVVVLPYLTKKRTQCGFFCPFGAFQSLFNKINLFEIRFDREKCVDCTLCQTSCPTVALSKESIREGKTLLNCMKCGACVDACKKDAAVWHLKGTAGRCQARARTPAVSLRRLGDGHHVRRQHSGQLGRHHAPLAAPEVEVGVKEDRHARTHSFDSGLHWRGAHAAVAVCVPFVLIGGFSNVVAHAGLHIDATYTRRHDCADHRSAMATGFVVYQPVQPRLLERIEPFVQLSFEPADSLPAQVSDEIDLDGDGRPDVRVSFTMPADPDTKMRGDVTALNGRLRLAQQRERRVVFADGGADRRPDCGARAAESGCGRAVGLQCYPRSQRRDLGHPTHTKSNRRSPFDSDRCAISAEAGFRFPRLCARSLRMTKLTCNGSIAETARTSRRTRPDSLPPVFP